MAKIYSAINSNEQKVSVVQMYSKINTFGQNSTSHNKTFGRNVEDKIWGITEYMYLMLAYFKQCSECALNKQRTPN